jgi:two-component system chemotaxis response regulator CheB
MVVDDSDATRAAVVAILRAAPELDVILSTRDPEEALRAALVERPDVVCLDLEMPRMDGFTFLRLLMARRPTPVIVISSNSRKQDVFKALELGALDFVAKPERNTTDLSAVEGELLAKIATVRALRIENLEPHPAPARSKPAPAPDAAAALPPVPAAPPPRPAPTAPPSRVVVIGASTGGPSALARLLGLLPQDLPIGIAIAQHMPEKFTKAFAERLDRGTSFDVREAADGEPLVAGRVLLAPGGKHLKFVRGSGNTLRAHVGDARPQDPRYRPSADILFESAAQLCGPLVCAVVLTGMGSDGRAGVRAVKAAGGLTIAESEQTAVVYGMPKEAVESGHVDEVLPLDGIVERIIEFAGGR